MRSGREKKFDHNQTGHLHTVHVSSGEHADIQRQQSKAGHMACASSRGASVSSADAGIRQNHAIISRQKSVRDTYRGFRQVFRKMFTALYTLYAIHIGGLLMRDYSEFLQVMSLPETPQIVTLLFLFAMGVYMVKSGVQTLGRWSKLALIGTLISVIATSLIAIKFISLNNLKPVAATPFPKLLGSSFSISSFSFADTILFLSLFGAVKPKKSPYRIFLTGFLIGAFTMLIPILRNMLVLGFPSAEMYFYPSYTATSVISLGEFFTRTEVFIGIALLLVIFFKISVCMFAASIGAARLFNLDTYQKMAVPVSLLMLTLAGLLFENALEMYLWTDVHKYYAIPFQFIFPLIIYVGAEIRSRATKKPNRNRTVYERHCEAASP